MGKILTLLAIILVLANAQCFVRCQLDSADRSTPPCHSQNKLSPQHCIEQHELSGVPAVPQIVIASTFETPSIGLASVPGLVWEGNQASPPLLIVGATRPLRI